MAVTITQEPPAIPLQLGQKMGTVVIPKKLPDLSQVRFPRCMRVLSGVVFAVWIGFAGACDRTGASETGAASLESNYLPVFAKAGRPDAKIERGTLSGDFAWAARAKTLGEARKRWLEFLARHDTTDGSYEDNFHAMRAITAKYELARIFYLIGDARSGDAYLHQADPLNLH